MHPWISCQHHPLRVLGALVLLGIPGSPHPGKARVRPRLVAARVSEEKTDKELSSGVDKGHPKLGSMLRVVLGYASCKGGISLLGAHECWV